jgi:ribosomal protein L11 methylase PrmA
MASQTVSVVGVDTDDVADTNAEMNAQTNGPLEVSTSVEDVERGVNWLVVVTGAMAVAAGAVVWRDLR